MTDTSGLRVGLLGDGDGCDELARLLRDRTSVVATGEELDAGLDAVVLGAGVRDPFARAKEALEAGLPVLCAGPFHLNPWQAARLSALSGSQRRLLRFLEPFQHRQGFPFLRRLLRGREPFWRPLYLRLLCLAEADGPARLDELATAELALCDALLEAQPQHVTAAAVRRDDVGDVCAAFLTLQYQQGTVVQVTLSLSEAASGRQLVAVTPDHTVVLDDLDPVASVRVLGRDAHDLVIEEGEARRGEEAAHRMLGGPGGDPVELEVARFLEAVAAGEPGERNSERWARVAALWWAARQSMSFDRLVEVPPTADPTGQTEPPPLRVIEGGGKTVRAARSRPALTVISR